MYGNIYSRPLTREEKNTRLQIAAAAALAGALGGAGISLGGSKLLRARVSSLEREAAEQVGRDFLDPLKELIGDWTAQRNALQAGMPQGAPPYKGLDKRIEKARVLLRTQERHVKGLADEAAANRAALPFVGGLGPSRSGSAIDWRPMSHEGVVGEHFDSLAKTHGYPEMNLNNAYQVFNDAVEKAMTKTSRAAFLAELEKISFRTGAARGASAFTGSFSLARRGTAGFLGRPMRSGGIRAPRAATLDATGKATAVDTSQVTKARNLVQPQEQLPPVKVSTPPTPDPTPGSP
jgi:hypothetical protein